MLRIHFTADDLARTTLADEPDELWEVLLSLHMLQLEEGPVPYGAWRQRMRRRLPRETIGPLAALAPPVGYSPDFLTPSGFTGGFEAGLDELLSTPRPRLRQDLSRLSTRRGSAAWIRQLAEAQPESLRHLGHAVRVYHRSALAPYWSSLRGAVRADHRQRLERMSTDGIGGVLAELHPGARWQNQVLEVADFPDEELRLDGRGIRLQPSYFCWRAPTKLGDHDLPPVLVYPIQDPTGLQLDQLADDSAQSLAALLGRTRATVLRLTVDGCTTTQLAVACNITLATASHQTAVLRDAGLIGSQRIGKSVRHQATALGLALLNGLSD
ncbi:ArsR/SmtB family transcription factor [Kribbella endophytica]